MQGWLQRYKYRKRPITSGRKAMQLQTTKYKIFGEGLSWESWPTPSFAVVASINWHVAKPEPANAQWFIYMYQKLLTNITECIPRYW